MIELVVGDVYQGFGDFIEILEILDNGYLKVKPLDTSKSFLKAETVVSPKSLNYLVSEERELERKFMTW